MGIYFKLLLTTFCLILSVTLNLNAKKITDSVDLSEVENDPSTLPSDLRKCIFKHAYFFPVTNGNSSGEYINPSQNFIKFCGCRTNQKLYQMNNSDLSMIDFCSNQHLNTFENEVLFNLNTRLIIEPDISERLLDQLKFVGPFIEKTSIIQTQRCMLDRIINDCNKQYSLYRTRKCALEYLNENWLYQNVYRDCQFLKFENISTREVNKI